jgi:hypothetical protein
MVDLGDRDVEPSPDALGQSFYDAALLLERGTTGYSQVEGGESDEHLLNLTPEGQSERATSRIS